MGIVRSLEARILGESRTGFNSFWKIVSFQQRLEFDVEG
jgi:hypothetical protein